MTQALDMQVSPDLLAAGFARHIVAWAKEKQALDGEAENILYRAALFASAATAAGHVCTRLEDIAEALGKPDCDALRHALLHSGMVSTCSAPGDMPLILDEEGRLYLHRYFSYERRLAHRVLSARSQLQEVQLSLAARLEALFPPRAGDTVRCDWQKVAAALALLSNFTIISGGPGTGKTTTVVALLACLLEHQPHCRIALAAPTGKAAARMQEAIRARAQSLDEHIRDRLPTESFTIHRLLGVTPTPGVFRHDARRPLAIDVLVVDEASMLDIALATKLFEAVPPGAKVILLGDKDQLAAVEAGTVFAELSANPALNEDCIAQLAALTGIPAHAIRPMPAIAQTSLDNSVVWLTESYRFSKDSGIGRLAASINAGDAQAALAALQSPDEPSLQLVNDGKDGLTPESIRQITDGYSAYVQACRQDIRSKTALFAAFSQFRVLCAVRESARGVDALNNLLSEHFRAACGFDYGRYTRSPWYPGRPIMVQRNDYALELFNGDIGITLPDDNGNLQVYFPQLDGSYRAIPPARLPEHETAFAITVHKSQGSEFDNIAFILPSQPSRIASRELVYTAVTRAKKSVMVVGEEPVFTSAIRSPTVRYSGLIRCLSKVL